MVDYKEMILAFVFVSFIVLSACQPIDNRRIVDIFNSGEFMECSYIEIPPEERVDFSRHEVIVSYRSDSIKLESREYEGFLMITRQGTIEPLLEDRHSLIYETAMENDCEYLINEDLTYDYVLRERYNQQLMSQLFGGIPFIMDESRTIPMFERENREKPEFRCRGTIPDNRFELEGKICDVKMFEEFLR